MTETPFDLVDHSEAARMLGLSREGLRYVVRQGGIAPIGRTTTATLYRRSEVERLAAQRRASPPKRGRRPG
jgi:DNA-binding transcriptional MerR regulator